MHIMLAQRTPIVSDCQSGNGGGSLQFLRNTMGVCVSCMLVETMDGGYLMEVVIR